MTEAAVREELERILAAPTFKSSPALRTLLLYLGQKTLEGAEPPKEYTIGVEAFGRPFTYDPQQDAYVRVQASKLRQRLQDYYSNEGAADRVIVELPKRQFLLEVRERSGEEPPPGLGRRSLDALRRYSGWVAAGLCLVWALTLTFTKPESQVAPLPPQLSEVWAPFLNDSRPVLICLGTHQFYSYRSGGFIREPGLDTASEEVRAARLEELRKALKSETLTSNQGYTGTGQATGAFLLGRFFAQAGAGVQLVRSSSVSFDDIASGNIIFVGSAKSNPQIRSIPAQWAYRIEGDEILNVNPAPGEPPIYRNQPSSGGGDRQEYALVSLVPGLHNKGRIMIIEAPTTTGIWAGALYFTDARYAAEFVSKAAGAGSKLPPFYQVVLSLQVRQAVPLRIAYIAHKKL